MVTRLPASSTPIWLLTAALPLGLIPTEIISFQLYVDAAGTTRDNMALPILGAVIVAAILLPIVILLTSIALRRYPAGEPITWWRANQPFRSTLFVLLFGLPGATLLAVLTSDFALHPAWELVPYAAYSVLWILWSLCLFGAVMTRGAAE